MRNPVIPVIVITGAGKGIGKCIVEEICLRAANLPVKPAIFMISRSEADLKTLSLTCDKSGLKNAFFAGDIGRPSDNTQAIEKCLASLGPITSLVNNAGVGRFASFSDLTLEDYDYVMQTNARGTFDLTQKVFKQMEKTRAGQMIFVTSVSAEKAFAQSAVYCMSKFAQKGLIEVLRLYGHRLGIRITHVMPGATDTPMWGETSSEFRKKMIDPKEVARVIVDTIFSSPQSSVEEIVIRPTLGDISAETD